MEKTILENVSVTSISLPYRGPNDQSSPGALLVIAILGLLPMVLVVGRTPGAGRTNCWTGYSLDAANGN